MSSPRVSTICKHTVIFLTVTLSCSMIGAQETDKARDECYKCPVNGIEECVVWELRCDGAADCDDGQDELYETCYGDPCVEKLEPRLRCDGIKDCADGRDEYYDGCDTDGGTSPVSAFGNVSVAVAVVFLISVMVALTALLFCICCCCRKGRQNRPYISKSGLDAKKYAISNSSNGYRWAAHTHPNTYSYTIDGNVVYNASEDSVHVNVS
ncbi:LDL receptor repeat-containing protein egg-1-like isoform X2 [Ptychodera flava]|uniref:LDL receptor repeat-containing protein egg-1-like isoform X2 n=1 Tax=Ptychodera flava TaxID=63121 RepID=UPI00396A086C